jgi:uncharacterized protein YjbI with pentapeptide repeats
LLLYNFIAGWRDDSQPGGVYLSRWYEHNREIGPPWEHLDTILMDLGTSGKFLDKPAFEVALHPPGLLPDIEIEIPPFSDPRNLDNSHTGYTLSVPAARVHMCYSVFVGNDNNDGTKINCLASDDGGATWPIKSKLTEGVEINQGVSLATNNFGQEVLAVWRRFSDNNETSAIMFAKSIDAGNTWSKADVLTEFCAFDQGTGAARFRTNALPVVVNSGGHSGDDFAVYFASRNDATETCFTPGKGKNPATPNWSTVALADDFDRFEEPTDPVTGARIKDGRVRTALNYSRIMMVRGSGDSVRSWSPPEAVDPQEYASTAVNRDGTSIPAGSRKRGHQFMPAAEAAGGLETIAWYDSRLDRLNTRDNPIPGGFVEDLVIHFEGTDQSNPNTWQSVSLLPAGVYDIIPPPPTLPPNANNIPLRRTIDVFAAQVNGATGETRDYMVDAEFYPAAAGITSPSTRVSRFPKRRTPDGPKQAEWNYPNGRLFRKGKSPFIGDYNSVAAAQFRQVEDGTWVPNQSNPVEGIDLFASLEPMFHIGWTSNRDVRGKVYYTGCDVWDETLQMWISGAGCDSDYTDPIAPTDVRMMPLQGEDGGADGPPLLCVPGDPYQNFPLTRNQNIYVAAMRPGFSANVLSAIKRPIGMTNTFVLGLDNGTEFDRHVVLQLPDDVLSGVDRMSMNREVPDLSITVRIPRGSTNSRTVFDFSNDLDDLQDTVVLTVRDCPAFDPESDIECVAPGAVLARVPLDRSTLETPPLENAQNKFACDPDVTDPGDINYCVDPIDLVGDGEWYDLILNREETLSVQSLDLENLDLENKVQMLDLENLDLENLDLENLDLENLDLENLDLENVLIFLDLENLDLENLDLENALYENLDLENLDLENLDLENDGLLVLDLENLDLENTFLQFLDLENLDLENLDLENLDLENLDLENLDLENLDLENLDLENLDLENQTFLALDLENLDLENLDLENSAPGDDYVEISWTADSATNTTTGVDVKPIFSPGLVEVLKAPDTDAKVLLTVRQPYMTSTVVANREALQSCAPQVVVQNQLLYAAILDANQINSLIGDPDPNDPNTPSFVTNPDQSTIITLRFINPPGDKDYLNSNSGVAIYAHPGTVNCDVELGGAEVEKVCEIDYVEPDETEPVISGLPTDPPPGTPFVLDPASSTFHYEVPGITAADAVDGLVDVQCVPGTRLNPDPTPFTFFWDFPVGSTTVTCTAIDAAGNEATASFTATVLDETAPIITAPADIADYPASSPLGTDVPIGMATATDNVTAAGDIEITNNAPTIFPLGPTNVEWKATDEAGNFAVATQVVTVADEVAPVITLTGENPQYIEAPNPYTELGATATDNISVSAAITIDASAVMIDKPDSYDVTYNVSDDEGNPAMEVIRTVIVRDITPPVIYLSGVNPQTLEGGSPYVELGATASDTLDGDITADIIIDSTAVNVSVVGPYSVTYDVTDMAGNSAAQVVRTVNVADTTPPFIVVLGANPQTIETGSPYVELGATAGDIIDGDLTAMISTDTSNVNTAVPGSYVVTYTVADLSGIAATPGVRTVNVVDTTEPTITLLGNNPQIIEGGDAYVELGATATDIADGDISGSIVIDASAVNTSVMGSYNVTYDVDDAANNAATQIIRIVTVTDTTPPELVSILADPFVVQTIESTATVFEAELLPNVVFNDIVTSSMDQTSTLFAHCRMTPCFHQTRIRRRCPSACMLTWPRVLRPTSPATTQLSLSTLKSNSLTTWSSICQKAGCEREARCPSISRT